jgi:phosphatidylglycerol---prolipoprotein diacylglyceryl transferase
MLNAINFPEWLHPEIIPGVPLLRWYGLMYLIAFSVTYILFRVQVKQRKLDIENDDILNFFFWGIVGLLLGARLFAVIIYNGEYYVSNPLEAFLPISITGQGCKFTGFRGMSYHGGLVGMFTALFIYWRVKKIDILDWLDMIAVSAPLGYFFGRLGNFINGELYGRVTSVPWGMYFPNAEKLQTDKPWVQDIASKVGLDISGKQFVNLPRHPSQLYEAFFEGIFLFAVLWFILRKRKPFKGFLISCYVMGYGLVRFFIEYTRTPDKNMGFPLKFVNIDNPGDLFITPWNFTTGQILCALMVIGGSLSLYIFWKLSKKDKKDDKDGKQKLSGRKLRKKLK